MAEQPETVWVGNAAQVRISRYGDGGYAIEVWIREDDPERTYGYLTFGVRR